MAGARFRAKDWTSAYSEIPSCPVTPAGEETPKCLLTRSPQGYLHGLLTLADHVQFQGVQVLGRSSANPINPHGLKKTLPTRAPPLPGGLGQDRQPPRLQESCRLTDQSCCRSLPNSWSGHRITPDHNCINFVRLSKTCKPSSVVKYYYDLFNLATWAKACLSMDTQFITFPGNMLLNYAFFKISI